MGDFTARAGACGGGARRAKQRALRRADAYPAGCGDRACFYHQRRDFIAIFRRAKRDFSRRYGRSQHRGFGAFRFYRSVLAHGKIDG